MLSKASILAVLLLFTNSNCSTEENDSMSSLETDTNNLENDAYTQLYEAAKNGSVDSIKKLLKQGLSVDQPDEESYTALQYAAMYGKLSVVEELLRSGANVNTVNAKKKTALMYAAKNGEMSVLQELLKNGADVNVENKDGLPALMLAVREFFSSIAEELLKNGADANFKDPKTGITPLHLASKHGDLSLVKVLVSKGADVNAKESNGLTPLHYASRGGWLDIVQFLLPLISDINAKENTKNETSLHLAAMHDHPLVLKELLEHGADINARTMHNETALHLGSFAGALSSVKVLLYNESSPTSTDVSLKNTAGLTALHYVANSGFLPIARELVEKVASDIKSANSESSLQVDAGVHQPDVLQAMKDYVNTKDNKGRTALHYAASRGKLDMIKLLCSYGADKNIMDIENSTILTVAAKQAQIKLLEELIFNNEDDANDLAPQDTEWSPFHKSAWKVMGLTSFGREIVSIALVVNYCHCFEPYGITFNLDEENVNGIQENFLSSLSNSLKEKLENRGEEGKDIDLDTDYLTESEKEELKKGIREAFHPILGKLPLPAAADAGSSAEKVDGGEKSVENNSKMNEDQNVLKEDPSNQKESDQNKENDNDNSSSNEHPEHNEF